MEMNMEQLVKVGAGSYIGSAVGNTAAAVVCIVKGVSFGKGLLICAGVAVVGGMVGGVVGYMSAEK
jgi:hypothetical protein